MRWIVLAVTLLLPAQASAAPWNVGQEREMEPGNFVKLFWTGQDWRVWRFETDGHRVCKAIKNSTGRRHPEPLGVYYATFGGTPSLVIEARSGEDWYIQGYWGSRTGKYRLPGERAYKSLRNNYDERLTIVDLFNLGETTIEVSIETWEYEAIKVGRVVESGTINLKGIKAAYEQLMRCRGDASGTFSPSDAKAFERFNSVKPD